jgi:hypothetical protein
VNKRDLIIANSERARVTNVLLIVLNDKEPLLKSAITKYTLLSLLSFIRIAQLEILMG